MNSHTSPLLLQLELIALLYITTANILNVVIVFPLHFYSKYQYILAI